MNCRDWEERLALYAGGDLPKDEAAEVEWHLGECPGCQLFSSGLKESQELFQEVHREPLSPAHFAAVRARVLAELELGRRPVGQTIVFCGLSAFWRRGWAFGFAAVAAALLLMLAIRPGLRPIPKSPVVALGHPRAIPLPVSAGSPEAAGIHQTQRVPQETARHQRPARPKAQLGEPVLIRIVSDDPGVVIYWIADTKGD